MKKIDEIKDLFKDFSNGIRVVFLIHRKKDGGTNRKTRQSIKKVITTNSEEFFKTIEELKEIKDNDDRNLRIYATINSRDIKKGIREFKQKILDNDYQCDKSMFDFYFDIKNRFIGSIMKPKCNIENNFLFDLDDCDHRSYIQMIEILKKNTDVLLTYETKNGYHIITKPFNYTKLDERFISNINKDALLLIDF